jgi:NADH-quinone oxidoreductase subunit L
VLSLTPWLLGLPLAGFVVIGLFARVLPRAVTAVLGCGTVLLAFAVALGNFFAVQSTAVPQDQTLWTWVVSGGLTINFGLVVDHLSAIMMLVVTGVGFLIHVYSVGYMADDVTHEGGDTVAIQNARYARFFSFMNLFIFAMALLVLADSFLFLLVGWALVGLASFLLIGFWFQRPSAVAAAQKAFVVNVIGDFGLMLAIFLLVGKFNTLSYAATILPGAANHFATGDGITTAIALLLIVAAAAKSAQLPLHIWLPDAMEGPTPVSALIHAATMVTAGVYLVARCHVLFAAAPVALVVVGIMGAASALFAATVALFQYDIKRVLAYSTMSQLGYMFLGESVGADNAAIFHLTTHAFFKALLFMAAGGVIHALHGEQDIRKMGGLRTQIPITFWSFVIGGLALAGIPPLAGFWSKDAILGAVLDHATATGNIGDYTLYAVGLLTAFLTGLYTFRLIFVVFFGEYRGATAGTARRGQASLHAHDVGLAMAVPMLVLLALSVIGGFDGIPGLDAIGGFLQPAVSTMNAINSAQTVISLVIGALAGLIGIALAWQRYGARPFTFTINRNPFYLLLANAYYLDPLFNAVIAQPVLFVGRALDRGMEGAVLDGGSRGVAWLVGKTSAGLRRLQTGYARNYALAILFGAVLIIVYYIWKP